MFFRTVLLPKLKELEQLRKQRRRLIMGLVMGICLLALAGPGVIAACAYGVISYKNIIVPLLSLSSIPAFLVLLAVFSEANAGQGWTMRKNGFSILERAFFGADQRRKRFSQEIIAPIVNYCLPGLRRLPGEYVGQADFFDSKFFGYNVGPYAGHNRFTGRLNLTADLDFSWLEADSVLSDKKGKKTYSRLFAGWFFVVHFPKSFRCSVIIQPDLAEAALGWLGRSIQELATPSHLTLLHLEDLEFEHYFRVHAEDQLEARYLLSPVFMRLATLFRKRLGAGLFLSFFRNCMYAALPGQINDCFDLMTTRSLTDPSFARHLYQAVKGVTELAESIEKNYIMWE